MVEIDQTTALLQERVRALLDAGSIDLFIGYKQGSNPLRITPHVVKSDADVDKLVWNMACINNLVSSLQKYPDQRVGILVKGCDSRALVELIKLHQIKRENVYIIGVVCPGILHPEQVAEKCPPAQITNITMHGNQVVIFAGPEIIPCNREELLFAKCTTCADPVPVLYDELIEAEEPPPANDPDRHFAEVQELEQRTAAERFAFWAEQFSECTLCYACQTVCPMCFCEECPITLARSDPKRKERRRESIFAFHLMRAYHMTGRCIGCYECERVCPSDIPLSLIFKKVEQDSRELFGYTAGQHVTEVPPLSTFDEERT